MVWMNLEPAEQAAIQELDSLSDRAAAIVGATILESRVLEVLKKKLPDLQIKPGSRLHDKMFGSSGPIGSFAARIDMAFMCQLIDEEVWRDLNQIRGLRNDFAHVTAIGSFKDQSVVARCSALTACERHFKTRQAGDPLMEADNIAIGKTPDIQLYAVDLESKLKDARQRYLLCVMYYSLLLKLPLVINWIPHFDLTPR